jgi:hypothetical protein
VCALGPSSHSVDVLEAMLNAGMVGARIDLTWGGLDFHRESLRALNVRKVTVGRSNGSSSTGSSGKGSSCGRGQGSVQTRGIKGSRQAWGQTYA